MCFHLCVFREEKTEDFKLNGRKLSQNLICSYIFRECNSGSLLSFSNTYIIFVGNLKGRDHLSDISVDGTIKLKYLLEEYDVMVRATVHSLIRYVPVVGSREHGNGLLYSIKGGEFLNQLNDGQIVKKERKP